MDIQARRLIFHSAVVMMVGVLCGLPLEAAFIWHWPAGSEQGWRLAHRGLLFGAVLGWAIAGILSPLTIDAARKCRLAWWFIVSNYAFCFSLVLSSIVGQRGLILSLPWTNLLVLLGNFIGTFSGSIGAILLLCAAYGSLQKSTSG